MLFCTLFEHTIALVMPLVAKKTKQSKAKHTKKKR